LKREEMKAHGGLVTLQLLKGRKEIWSSEISQALPARLFSKRRLEEN
jgi:hypothetical protein